MQTLSIAVGGAFGALLRFWMSSGVHALFGRGFPFGTLAVNVIGSLVMGVLYVYMVERGTLPAEWRAGLMIGLLGAFTTFSAFSIETISLIETGEPAKALANVFASVAMCMFACWLGLLAARQL